MSALPPEADMFIVEINVCYVPLADVGVRDFATSALVSPLALAGVVGLA